MSVLDKNYIIEAENGEEWSIPVRVIAENRAKYYASKGLVFEEVLKDTDEYFSFDHYLNDWACNNMNWDEVKEFAKKVKEPSAEDLQEMWTNPKTYRVME